MHIRIWIDIVSSFRRIRLKDIIGIPIKLENKVDSMVAPFRYSNNTISIHICIGIHFIIISNKIIDGFNKPF